MMHSDPIAGAIAVADLQLYSSEYTDIQVAALSTYVLNPWAMLTKLPKWTRCKNTRESLDGELISAAENVMRNVPA